MKFSLYDLLSQILIGFIWLVAIILIWDLHKLEGLLRDVQLASIPISYALGYFINTFASWAENWMFKAWGGKPSRLLIQGNAKSKIRLKRQARTHVLLREELDLKSDVETPADVDAMFLIAMSYIGKANNNRIQEFNASYAFSRGMVVTTAGIAFMLILSIFLENSLNEGRILFALLSIIAFFISLRRTKERGYYFAREVLNNYLREKQPPQSE
ncbi:MAG: hypothetical protein AAF206_27145 [Bacteroidota bacterium]